MPVTGFFNLGGYRDEMRPDGWPLNTPGLQPANGALGVGEGFLGRPGLGANDKQRCLGVQWCQRAIEIVGIDVGDKMRLERRGLGMKRLADEPRTEIGAADTEIDHIRKRLTRATCRPAAVDAVDQHGHPGERVLYLL